eukprot:gnl/Hemi2/4218_TR1468_c0_g1_i1.p1 gnl/Hemi2/4218_TR1468_c0_g1~~gnl/Hemi2/4218_TR1468_c0_g1_i1.p1  ORF type:complete len:404 (+),score=-21.98 gnl/Hemi2/4218_TR1468_c0_g1_i1:94-1212(+)
MAGLNVTDSGETSFHWSERSIKFSEDPHGNMRFLIPQPEADTTLAICRRGTAGTQLPSSFYSQILLPGTDLILPPTLGLQPDEKIVLSVQTTKQVDSSAEPERRSLRNHLVKPSNPMRTFRLSLKKDEVHSFVVPESDTPLPPCTLPILNVLGVEAQSSDWCITVNMSGSDCGCLALDHDFSSQIFPLLPGQRFLFRSNMDLEMMLQEYWPVYQPAVGNGGCQTVIREAPIELVIGSRICSFDFNRGLTLYEVAFFGDEAVLKQLRKVVLVSEHSVVRTWYPHTHEQGKAGRLLVRAADGIPTHESRTPELKEVLKRGVSIPLVRVDYARMVLKFKKGAPVVGCTLKILIALHNLIHTHTHMNGFAGFTFAS